MVSDYHYPQYRLLVFSKAPQLGKVKTRMQPVLTCEESMKLHIQLSRYCIQQWQDARLCPIDIWVAGDLLTYQQQVVDDERLNFYAQAGRDLGERLQYAAHTTLRRSSVAGILLVGTDCPFIDTNYLQKALLAMKQNNDGVIAPATDGGYVLLGMKAYHSALFDNIQWGGEKVYTQTLTNIHGLSLTYSELESLPDIDRPEDLPLLEPLGFGKGAV